MNNRIPEKERNNRIAKIIKFILGEIEYGAFLGFFEAAYLNMTVFSLVQLINPSISNILETFSYVCALSIFVLSLIFPFAILKFAIQYKNLEELGDNQKSLEF